jgi:predicted transcriptional regulator of viral defense system
MPNIYSIRDAALGSRRLVFDYDQLAALSGVPRGHARVYASRLVQRGLATKVAAGILAFTEDPFVVATQLVEPSYVSFFPALYLRGIVSQVPTLVECITTKSSRTVAQPRVRYHSIAPSLFFGFDRLERYGSYVFVARPEKATLDAVYFGESPRIGELRVDKGKLVSMSKAYVNLAGWRGKRVAKWVEAHAE